MNVDVKRTERGWAGHFICADRCLFRRNTLLELDYMKIVVSTVGLMMDIHSTERGFKTIGCDRYYETMAFHSDINDSRYHDINMENPVDFDSEWEIGEVDADDRANLMHESVVDEIVGKMISGKISQPLHKCTTE